MKAKPSTTEIQGIVRWRFGLVLLAFGALLLIVAGRLVYLHTIEHPFLYEQGEKRTLRTETQPAVRGTITDRFGKPIAVSTPVVDLWINPKHFSLEKVNEVAQALGLPAASLKVRVQRATQQGRSFLYLKRQVQPAIAQQLLQKRIAGVYGQDNGEWIDASVQPVEPKREASTYILKAEQVLQQAYQDKSVIIRPSGIYGTERLMRVRKAREPNKPPMPQYDWSNRIMDTDLINIIANVMTLSDSEIKPIYLATDYAPVTTYEMAKWFGEKLDTSVPEISDATTVSGKRLHSNIPLAWLEYPDWQSGYSMILQYL